MPKTKQPNILVIWGDDIGWFGSSDASLFYDKWMADRAFLLVPAQAIVSEFLKTFEEFPPRQHPASFSIDQALDKARESEKKLQALHAA